MEKTKKLVKEYKLGLFTHDIHGQEKLEDDLEYLPRNLRELADYAESLIDEGFTTLDVNISGWDGSGTAYLSYFKEREETDEEFQARLKVELEGEEKAERRRVTIAGLSQEQRDALGIR
jgi:RNase adaptor protein for sRNA GlmZ degradation